MADSLSTIGSIATYIYNNVTGLTTGISGNLPIIVDSARQHVANFTGASIGSNAIADKYQPPIVDFAMADVVDLMLSQAGGEDIKLSELSISENGELMSADQYRQLGEMKLKAIGRKIRYARSLS